MSRNIFFWLLLCPLISCHSALAQTNSLRRTYDLAGDWQLQVDGQTDWREIQVPGTFEAELGIQFDGIASYRRTIPPFELKPDHRLLLHFDAVATKATVWFNDVQVGQHLGGWTPFRMDITHAIDAKSTQPWELRVRVDELVGHNTQGFLPIIAPHFGGIWQDVRLIEVAACWFDEIQSGAVGNLSDNTIRTEFRFSSIAPYTLRSSIREKHSDDWTGLPAVNNTSRDPERRSHIENQQLPLTVAGQQVFRPRAWSLDDPVIYQLKTELITDEGTDVLLQSVAFRDIKIDKDRFLLNGRPLIFRGLLNWGYAPPRNAPSIDEKFMRNEIEFAQSRGFNLMKFCLWIPPKRYLELCDEMGMLAWIEYPTWHPDFSQKHLADLRREYDEFFFHDRNHPSVVLRSLTCETGPSADLDVIRTLYEQCKQRVADAIVVDDSSWIAWNRVFDFYDDHPYGNNHTWVATLARLKNYISEREIKPLVLGEAITADTWFDPSRIDKSSRFDEMFWQPRFLDSASRWKTLAQLRFGPEAVDRLYSDSLQYAMLMRKYQIETFHREVPNGGYVVSVIRDMPKACMGLIDYWDKPKWQTTDWSWHSDTMLLLKTRHDRRSFVTYKELTTLPIEFQLIVKRSVPATDDSLSLAVSLFGPGENPARLGPAIQFEISDSANQLTPFDIRFDSPGQFPNPQRLLVHARLLDKTTGNTVSENSWPIWVVPEPDYRVIPNNERTEKSAVDMLLLHPSVIAELHDLEASNWKKDLEPSLQNLKYRVVFTRTLDNSLLSWMNRGGNVLLLPNNSSGSFPLEGHWFLRGGPLLNSKIFKQPNRNRTNDLGKLRQMLVELQHFDLASDVVPNIDYLDRINSMLMLWETHDLTELRTNGLVFHMPVGSGNLLVSALNHFGENNPAGQYLLSEFARMMTPAGPRLNFLPPAIGPENYRLLRQELTQREINLENLNWRFAADPDANGKQNNWHSSDFDDSAWPTIKANRHWESQGYPALDNWAWYRISVNLPDDWTSTTTYLNFTGVDDYYDLYVEGELIGSDGNIETRQTAFENRKSHDVSRFAKPGASIQIAVAVYDWQGAGGIFRPVSLSTTLQFDKPRILK